MSFHKILCPIDWSEPSFEALKTAGEWAEHFAAELIVLHVTEPLQHAGLFLDREQLEALMRKEARKRLQATIPRKLPYNVSVPLLVRTGSAANEIVEFAQQENIDLLIMATHGQGQQLHDRVNTVLFGSVTDNVMRISSCPVLTVPPTASNIKSASPERA